MWGGFPKVVREVFPNAKLVVDRFHVMQALIKELNTIRKQTRVTEKGARFLILKNKVDLKESEKEKLERILKCSSRLRQAYKLKGSLGIALKAVWSYTLLNEDFTNGYSS
jgi:transposase